MLFEDLIFFSFIMFLSLIISAILHQIHPGPFKMVIHVLEFVGVIVHEFSHALISLLMGVPVKDIEVGWRSDSGSRISPHGHVEIDPYHDNFLKDVMISFAPLFVSTWLFMVCFSMIFDTMLNEFLRVFCGLMSMSLILGAAPSNADLSGIIITFQKDVRYSLYQLFLVMLSIITVIIFVFIFQIMIPEYLYFFLIIGGYLAYKYAFLGLSQLKRIKHSRLRLEPKFSINVYRRRTRRPKKPIELGFEEAQW